VSHVRYVLWPTVCAVLLASLVACNPISLDRCEIKIAAPYTPVITKGVLIRGDATVSCSGPVDTSYALLALERLTGTGWQAKDQDTSNRIPYPKAVQLTVVMPCSVGQWRLRYEVRASYQGQTDQRGYATEPLAVNSYQDCTRTT